MQPRTNRYWLALVPFLLVCAALGARALDLLPMWGDEWNAIKNAGGWNAPLSALSTTWERVATTVLVHPPGHSYIIILWGQLAGWSVFAQRWLSVLVGLFGVVWTYRVAADYLSPRAGLFAAALLATSAIHTDQMQDIRVYVYGVALTPFVLWCYLRLAVDTRPASRWVWVGLFVGVAGLLYLAYTLTVALAGIGLFHLLLVRKNRRWWMVTGVFVAALVCFLPWASVLLSAIGGVSESYVQSSLVPLDQVVTRTIYLFANGVPVLFLALAILALAARGRMAAGVWIFATSGLAALLLVQVVIGIILIQRFRYATPLWALFALLMALGWMQLRRFPIVQWGVFAVLIAIGIWRSADPTFADDQGNNYPEGFFRVHLVERVVEPQALDGDFIMYYVPDALNRDLTYRALSRYDNDDVVTLARQVAGRILEVMRPDEEYELKRADIGDQRLRVWFATMPDYAMTELPAFQENVLEASGLQQCEQVTDSTYLDLTLYARSPVCCHPERAAPTHRYGDGVTILGVDVHPREGDTLPVGVAWSISPDVPPDTYSVTLQLWDENRTLVAQVDAGLDDLRYLCQRAAIPIGDVPASDYSLWAAVYDWQTGERLPGQDLTNGGVSDMLHLADVTLP